LPSSHRSSSGSSPSSCRSTTSPVTLGTPRRALVTTSHQCTINLLHAIQIRVLILGTSGGLMRTSLVTLAGKLLDLFF
jgi:hypothetical protein